jgi:Pectate lyase superfamily protein
VLAGELCPDPTIADKRGVSNNRIVDRRCLLALAAGLPAWPANAKGAGSTGASKLLEMLTVKQFGATGDGKTNDHIALQTALAVATLQKRDLFWPQGIYKTDVTLLKPQDFFCPNMTAEEGTVLDGSGIANGPTLKIKGGSGRLTQARIEGFTFAAGNGKNSTGLEITDQCGVEIRACAFQTGTWGLTFHNEHGFTEYAQAVGCHFASRLTSAALRYRVTKGTESFNGSGLLRCRINMDGAQRPDNAIVIGSGALLYHTPLDFQVWVKGKNRTIVNNISSFTHLTHGTITLEVADSQNHETAPELFGGSGSISYHQGDITTFGTAWLGPKMKLSGSLNKRIGAEGGIFNGSTAIERQKFGIIKKLAAGETNLQNITDMGSCIAHVHVSAPNYDYRYLAAASVGINGQPGVASIMATLSQFNSTGAGAPVFGVNETGDLTISNENYGPGYIASVMFLDLGPSLFNVGVSMADYKPT